MLVNFDELCPPDKNQEIVGNGKSVLGNFQICGKEVPRGYWVGAFLHVSSNSFMVIMLCNFDVIRYFDIG